MDRNLLVPHYQENEKRSEALSRFLLRQAYASTAPGHTPNENPPFALRCYRDGEGPEDMTLPVEVPAEQPGSPESTARQEQW